MCILTQKIKSDRIVTDTFSGGDKKKDFIKQVLETQIPGALIKNFW